MEKQTAALDGARLPFAEIWMADFEFVVGSGEKPRPVCMVAEEFWSGHQIRLWEDELQQLQAAPFDTGPNAASSRISRAQNSAVSSLWAGPYRQTLWTSSPSTEW